MGMTPFRFAIAVCCGLVASSVLYVSQKADGSTLFEVAANLPSATPGAAIAATPFDSASASAAPATASRIAESPPAASASLASKPSPVATGSAPPKPAPRPPATPSVAVKAVPSVTPAPSARPSAPPASRSATVKAPSTAPKAAKQAPGNQGDAAPKRIIIRHSQPGDVVFTMQGDDLQVEFRQAPSPKRQGGRS